MIKDLVALIRPREGEREGGLGIPIPSSSVGVSLPTRFPRLFAYRCLSNSNFHQLFCQNGTRNENMPGAHCMICKKA